MRKFVTIIKVKNYTAMTLTAVMGMLSSYLQECLVQDSHSFSLTKFQIFSVTFV